MRAALVVLAVTSLARIARADDGDAPIAPAVPNTEIAGAVLAGKTDAAKDFGAALEALYQPDPSLPLFVRGRLATGAAHGSSSSGTGIMVQPLAGGEARFCVREVCLLGGLDVGYESQSGMADDRNHRGVLVGLHAGADVGLTDTVRLRAIVDAFEHYDNVYSDPPWHWSGDLSVGVAYRY
jgi:hypothetical protein